MTAPLTRTSDAWVALLPIEPEDQDGADFAERYPEGAAVRLGLTDGLVLAHCRERPEGPGEETHGELAVIVATPDGCPDAGQVRVWRGSQIIDSPLSGDGIADLRRAIPRQRGAFVVEAIRRRWSAVVQKGALPTIGIADESVPVGTAETEDASDPEEEGEDSPLYDGEPLLIPVGVLDHVSDESLCEIRRAAADGNFGSEGYALIDGMFRSRAELARMTHEQAPESESARLRYAMFHYCGLYADLRDEGDATIPPCLGRT